MNRKTFSQLLCMLITAVGLITIFPLSSCGDNTPKVYEAIDRLNGDNYKTFVAQKGIPKFSFEYPSYYALTSYQSIPEYPTTNVRFIGSSTQENDINKQVEIYVNKFSEDAKTDLNERISEYKSYTRAGISKDFKLKEKNPVVVAGIEGWELIVSETILPVVLHGMDDAIPVSEPTPVVSREVFLDYQDMVWRISIFSAAALDGQAKADYEHILRTFIISD